MSALALSISWMSQPKEHEYRLYVFEGSDWCHNCIRLDQKVLSTTDFMEFAQNESILVMHIDFPQKKKLDEQTTAHNAMVAEKYNFKGIFPTLILVHNESGRQTELSYANEDVETFIAKVEMEKTELR